MAMTKATGLALLTAIALTACGTDTGMNDMKSVLQGITKQGLRVDAGGTQTAPDTAAMLAGTSGPLTLVSFDMDGATAGLLEIETNGAYRTFGTADRRSVTFKHGLVTATRGLGHDIMSVDADASLNLIRARKSGSARRVMRFLDGENKTQAISFDCRISAGEAGTTSNGAVTAQTRSMTEYCTSDDISFNASYAVTGQGEIVQSHQWMSPARGMAKITVLRR